MTQSERFGIIERMLLSRRSASPPERACWVAAEHWHPEQEGAFLDDGNYQLRLPYSNDPELIMDVLKYGPDCEVVAPAGLRENVVGLLKAAARKYGDE